ncbi:hypothetical protein JBE04_41545 [Streptomyces sp. PRKS01-29]|nr:hypothetical protein [Streptomyces sabulosicollis]MBI0300765.1 hypothetical protein [Streptomyces sabulosicollis]
MNAPASHASLLGTHRFTLHGRDRTGANTFFAYHISLFNMPPHKFQMALRIQLTDYMKGVYLNDRPNKPAGFNKLYYSLNTQPDSEFALYDIYYGNRDHFEARIERVYYNSNTGNRKFEEIPSPDAYIQVQCTHYLEPIGDGHYANNFNGLLFGSDRELFLAHRLSEYPNWDEVRAFTYHQQQLMPRTLDDVAQVTITGLRDTLETNHLQSPFDVYSPGSMTVIPRCGGEPFSTQIRIGEQQWWNSTTLNDPPM